MARDYKLEKPPQNLREIYEKKSKRELQTRLGELQGKIKQMTAELRIGGSHSEVRKSQELSLQLMRSAVKLIRLELTTRDLDVKF